MVESALPAVNATLNATSAALLLGAYVCVRRKLYQAHAALMIAALSTSAAFLACYLIYHATHGERSSGLPAGVFKTAYLSLLASHVVLAVVVLPMILLAVWQAWQLAWGQHRRIAKPTFWIWFYVSVTGVIVYVTLYHVIPAGHPPQPSGTTPAAEVRTSGAP